MINLIFIFFSEVLWTDPKLLSASMICKERVKNVTSAIPVLDSKHTSDSSYLIFMIYSHLGYTVLFF